jgi:hypothetical protein
MNVDYEYGRISDIPDGWDRSKKGNLTRRCRYGRVTVFRYPDGSRYEGIYGIIHVRSGIGSEPIFDEARYDTEEDALYAAQDIIESEMLE